jgi:AcrR family transcriptional regulator
VSTNKPSYRKRQAAETRARVAGAARRVFAERGYSAATITDVADAAGVAIPTVYKIYRSKPGLLAAVIDAWRAEFVPESFDAIPLDPPAALAWWAATVRRQWESGLDVATIFAGAVASEPAVRKELSARLATRDEWVRRIADIVEPRLATGRTIEDAAAILSALALPAVYEELVIGRGWTTGAYETWLSRTLESQLLGASSVSKDP